MMHQNKTKRLGRYKKQREALVRHLTIALFEVGRITTTLSKAKVIRPKVEKMITQARKPDVATKRLIISRLFNNKKISKKLFEEIAPMYKDRAGGYTRILKLPPRKSDGAKMAIIELVK